MRLERHRAIAGLTFVAVSLAPAAEPALHVSVAVSLKPAVAEAGERFRVLDPEFEILLNSGASAALLQQTRRGAPVDLLISASPLEIDQLVRERLAPAAARRKIATNTLVVVVPRGRETPRSLAELTGATYDRIAFGNPRTTPVGRYARQALVALDLWDRLAAKRVYAENARHVLDLVVRGEVAAGLVYRTDAQMMPERVEVAFPIPTGLHEPVVYEGVVLTHAPGRRAAAAFLEWLAEGPGREILERHGFKPLP